VSNGNGEATVAVSNQPKPSGWWWFCGQVFDLARLLGRALIVAGCIVACVYLLSSAVRSFAGQLTYASVTLNLLANVIVKWALTATISGLSLALYWRERNQHEKTRERLTKRITELEKRVNPTRTSSHLTPKGRTRKGDE